MRPGPGIGRTDLANSKVPFLRGVAACCLLASLGCAYLATQQESASLGPTRSDISLPTGLDAGPVLPAAATPLDASLSQALAETPSTVGRPARLLIPTIDVATRLSRLGLRADSTVQVPTYPDRAGWYRYGTRPGDAGAAVILGHVDSVEGPAVFARLGTLARGDSILVVLASGRRVEFRVRAVRTYLNDDFPARRVYRGGGDHHALNLVTCAGEYRSDAGGYQSNVVVFTRQVRA
ncbi:MAG: sortase [Nocardioides sp.]